MVIPKDIQQKFTSRAIQVLERLEFDRLTSLADLLGVIYETQGSLGSNFLKAQALTAADFKPLKELLRQALPGEAAERALMGAVLKKAVAVAALHRHFFVGTQHLLFGILYELNRRPELKAAAEAFTRPLQGLERSLKIILESGSHFPRLKDFDAGFFNQALLHEKVSEAPAFGPGARAAEKTKPDVKFLKRPAGGRVNLPSNFGQDLTALARSGGLDPLVGREREVSRIVQIFCRRTKSNPLLIGEAGVGKTAIVHGLAQRIVAGKVPAALLNKKVYDLRLSLLVAGTMFRGEFEARLEAIIQEAKRNEVILFIDEIHNIVGAGSAQGSLDAANILKPPLAHGEIQVIGATTLEEYHRYIERDKALERRFQPVFIQEPTIEQAQQILAGLKDLYERFHNVSITPPALAAAVELSSRYLTDRFLPDKAIDVLDEAASRARSQHLQTVEVMEIRRLTEALAECAMRKEREIERAAYDQAFEIKNQEKSLKAEITRLEKKIETQEQKRLAVITERDIERAVAEMTGVPVERLTYREGRRLQRLSLTLSRRVIGQPAAIERLARAIRRARAGLARPSRPLGSFLFMGPTGVGKTELSRVLADVVFGPDAFIKLDMSEYMEPHTVSRLLGAPAGYVGYGDSAYLAQAVRHRPYSLVLFDEVEKAHPQVLNVLLQILEDGQVTDATGREINFKNTIVILTSNIGTARFTDRAALGFGSEAATEAKLAADFAEIEKEALHELREALRPELIDRLDEIIVFQPLGQRAIRQIVKKQVKEIQWQLAEQRGFELAVSPRVTDFLVKESYKPRQGARLVRRVIQNVIEDTVAAGLIDGAIRPGKRVALTLKAGKPALVS